MRLSFLCVLALVSVTNAFAGRGPAVQVKGGPTIDNLPNFPKQQLKRSVTAQLYKSVCVSPVTAWVVAEVVVNAAHTSGAKIIRSDAGGAFDKMALGMANEYTVMGQNTTESRARTDYMKVHLLIFKIADGYMGINFCVNDDARYADYLHYSPAWVGIEKGGKWTTISHNEIRASDHYPKPYE